MLDWYDLVQEGATMLARACFEKILHGEVPMNILENAVFEPELAYGCFRKMDPLTIEHFYRSIVSNYSEEYGLYFLKLLSGCELNEQSKTYIKNTLIQDLLQAYLDKCLSGDVVVYIEDTNISSRLPQFLTERSSQSVCL